MFCIFGTGKHGGVLAPLGAVAQILCHVLVSEEELLVTPLACYEIRGKDNFSNHLLSAAHLLQIHQRAGVQTLRPRPLDVAHTEGADGPLPPLQPREGEGGDDVTRGPQVGVISTLFH